MITAWGKMSNLICQFLIFNALKLMLSYFNSLGLSGCMLMTAHKLKD